MSASNGQPETTDPTNEQINDRRNTKWRWFTVSEQNHQHIRMKNSFTVAYNVYQLTRNTRERRFDCFDAAIRYEDYCKLLLEIAHSFRPYSLLIYKDYSQAIFGNPSILLAAL
mmetsp:Transcript_6286/g.12327  ORF Transcript_6286/g.12327 Transcript_6286/m.12327 type:complete len:113 (+) Transcript_6286:1150-1488(+)